MSIALDKLVEAYLSIISEAAHSTKKTSGSSDKEHSLIQEGGRALKGVTKIKRENIPPTIQKAKEELYLPLGIPEELFTFEIGSAGKKPYSADLDSAIDLKKAGELQGMSEVELKDKIKAKLAEKNIEFAEHGGLINYKFPIQGDQIGEYVQIDIIPTNNIAFTKYRLYSPSPDVSKYKSKFRLTLLQKIVKTLTERPSEDNNGETFTTKTGRVAPIKFRHTSLNNDGIWDVTKNWRGKRVPILKTPEKIKELSIYLHDDPQRLLDDLFGPGAFTVADTESFETIWNNILMSDKISPEMRARIIKSYYFGLAAERNDYLKKHPGYEDIDVDYPIPKEITDWLEKNSPETLEIDFNEITDDD